MADSPFILEIILTLISGLVMILIIALPLLPAILIYKIFPSSQIVASGKIGALTWNASGAFAAYMVVLVIIVTSPLKDFIFSIGGFYSPTWTVEAEIHGYDYESKPTTFNDIDVILNPDLHRVGSRKVLLKIPGFKRSEWPVAIFLTSGGQNSLNLASMPDDELEIDYFNKHIKVLNPVILRQVPQVKSHYPPPGSSKYLTAE